MNILPPVFNNFAGYTFGWKAVAAAIVAVWITAPAANAATTTANMSVQLTLADSCAIDSVGNMDFGAPINLAAALNATADILITCTLSSPYTIELDAGGGAGATTAVRKMTDALLNTVNYSLYKEVAHTNVWGTGATDDVDSAGTAAQQTFTVFGLVPAQATPPAGAYTDTVQVAVTF